MLYLYKISKSNKLIYSSIQLFQLNWTSYLASKMSVDQFNKNLTK